MDSLLKYGLAASGVSWVSTRLAGVPFASASVPLKLSKSILFAMVLRWGFLFMRWYGIAGWELGARFVFAGNVRPARTLSRINIC